MWCSKMSLRTQFMKCPKCNKDDLSVLEKRDIDDDIRRRRHCNSCDFRFTTYERIEVPQITVLKRDGTREHYDEDKVRTGILVSCKNRPLQPEQIDNSVINVSRILKQGGEQTVSSNQIGELVLNELLNLDKIAYLRFVSVHRSFNDIESFKKEIQKINKD